MLVKSNLFPRQLWTCCACVHGWLLAWAKDLVLRALSAVRENQILNNLAFKTIWAKPSLSLSDQAKQLSIWCKGTSAVKGQKRWWGLEHTPRKQIYPNWMWRNKSIQSPLTLQGMTTVSHYLDFPPPIPHCLFIPLSEIQARAFHLCACL